MSRLPLNENSLLRIGALGLALMMMSTISLANDSDRITQLENELKQLKQRLSNLEKPPGTAVTSPKPIASTDGWKNLSNWRSVRKGMNPDEVRSVLGEPATVRATGPMTRWGYSNGGYVQFWDERLDGWNEPR
jgi:hypothetical protein